MCSLRNKETKYLEDYNSQVLVIFETYLDSSLNSPTLNIDGYNIFRLDRSRHGGGVACYAQNHIRLKKEQIFSSVVRAALVVSVIIGVCY